MVRTAALLHVRAKTLRLEQGRRSAGGYFRHLSEGIVDGSSQTEKKSPKPRTSARCARLSVGSDGFRGKSGGRAKERLARPHRQCTPRTRVRRVRSLEQ